ncbi:hypothetical protein [Caulobacter sp. Root1472]|jgi:hypothetical protein|uniref:hypothetical protein n=1 Tax=Caulobacter sp. Root1472 TaxID=1736470 RepID=UPI00070118D0|nr:hypothetical protein [Caulobacter sp. Root1472]KQZ21940.1 hypothetical protein ASD47_07305 [Caulobacter sp. Root1472]
MRLQPDSGWPSQWRDIADTDEAVFLTDELYREMLFGHSLHHLAPVALARRNDNDDVIFLASDGRIAQVHLTWAEREPGWPIVVFHSTLDDWAVAQIEE